MRRDIEFKTEDGVTLSGWHYLPDGRKGRSPTIVMAHGFSAVKRNVPRPVREGIRGSRIVVDRIR